MLPRVNIGDAVPAGRGTRLHVSVECLHAADCILLWPEATHLWSATTETARVQPRTLLTNVDCSRPVGVCMSVEARLVRDSIIPTSVDLTVSTLLI